MKIIGIIPSRYSSTRFEGKPLAIICRKPMIQHVYERAIQSGCLTEVFIATDDDRIVKAVNQFGGKSILTSPECRSGTDRAAEAAEKLGLDSQDIVVNIQGDQPLLNPVSIHEVIQPYILGETPDMTTLIYKIIDPQEYTNPKDVKVVFDKTGYALYFSRSPIPYAREKNIEFDQWKHLGVYAYSRRFLEIFRNLPSGKLEEIEKLEQLRAIEFGYRIKVIQTKFDSPEVDIPDDILRIETFMKNNQ